MSMLNKSIFINPDSWERTGMQCYELIAITECPVCLGIMFVKAVSHDDEPEVTYGYYTCLNPFCKTEDKWNSFYPEIDVYDRYEYEVGISGVSAPTKICI